MPRLVTIGHLSIDYIDVGDTLSKMLGGPPAYVSLAAISLGVNASVISKVGGNFPSEYILWLRSQGVDFLSLEIIQSVKTTSYMLKETEKGRVLRLLGKAPPITARDVPLDLDADAIHISPIAGEVDKEVMEITRGLSHIHSLDPQGLVRQFNKDGLVRLVSLKDKSLLSLFDIVKVSETEAYPLTGFSSPKMAIRELHNLGVKIAIITMREKGTVISEMNKGTYLIPAYKPKKIIDSTGAGDTYIGAFLAEYLHGRETLWCGCVGSAAASVSIERIGPAVFTDLDTIYERAQRILESTRRIQET